MKRLFRNNGLSIILALLFFGFWGAQAWTGYLVHNHEKSRLGEATETFTTYLGSGAFWSVTAENWESEFLQMSVYVIFTVFLYQKGSAESKDPDAKEAPENIPPRKNNFLYKNSLSLALFALFVASFIIHTASALTEYNEEQVSFGQQTIGLGKFLTRAELWFQSFQNWQSEFLAVLCIVVFSIFLRQQGSPESKKVSATNQDTGS